jgi:UDP-glucuronate 4-epimerase
MTNLRSNRSQARDFTYIDDIARGTILAGKLRGGRLSEGGRGLSLGNPRVSSYDVINLGGGNNPMSITAMIAIMEQALGKQAVIAIHPASVADMQTTWASIGKAQHLLCWVPQIYPIDGFRRTADWHFSNHDLVKHIIH